MTRRNQPLPQKRKRDLYLPIGLTALDFTAIVAGLALAYLIRFHSPVSSLPFVNQGHLPADYVRLFPIAVACWKAAGYE